MRKIFFLLSSCLLLTGCGGGSGSSPGPVTHKYHIVLTIAPAQNSNSDDLAYGADATGTITISGGGVADYPSQLQFVDANQATVIEDPLACLNNSTHQQTCQFTIHNAYAGPNASTPLSDNFQVTATVDGNAIQSNSVPLTLDGHESASAEFLYTSNTQYNT